MGFAAGEGADAMNIIASLQASSEAFHICGEKTSVDLCNRMIREVRSMDEVFGEGAGEALHKHWASQLAERAATKLEEYNQRRVA